MANATNEKKPDSPSVMHTLKTMGILHGFGFALPFRKRNKAAKDSPSRSQPIQRSLRPRELIELASFGIVELDPQERGIGHDFQPADLKNPTWCDRCGDLIWGLYASRKYLRCQYCQFTCHLHCEDLVTVDCTGIAETPAAALAKDAIHLEENNGQIKINGQISDCFLENTEQEQLRQMLESYNKTANGLTMTLEDGRMFRGFIRVHLNLIRPINVVAGTRPPSIYDILKDEEDSGRKTLTTFYLPRDTVKALHITRENTTREVIMALLRKFKVIDNPHKYALYEKRWDDETNQVNLRRIQDHENPLVLALMWSGQDKQFVLQENETGDIQWEDFAMAELKNFLKILDREEDEYLNQVRRKYQLLQQKMLETMAQLQMANDQHNVGDGNDKST